MLFGLVKRATYCLVKERLVHRGVMYLRWINRWPVDLVVPGSSSAGGGNPHNSERGSISHTFSSSPSNSPDMTEII